MFSRTFKYKGYDGTEKSDTWWFNLSESELYKLELSSAGGVNQTIRKLFRNDKNREIVDFFENLILSAVGERSADGRKFIKNEELRQDFYQSKAYDLLFVELVSSSEKLRAFIRGAIPAEMAEALEKEEAAQNQEENGGAPTAVTADAAD